MGDERQNIDYSENCGEVQRGSTVGICVVRCIIIHPCEETDFLRQVHLGPNLRP